MLAGSTSVTVLEHRRDDHAVPLLLEQRRRTLGLSRTRDEHVSTPPRSGETCWSSKSSMLIRSAPSACVIAASTPGRSGTCTRSWWRSRGRDRPPRASGAGCRPPRRSSARESRRRLPRGRSRAARCADDARPAFLQSPPRSRERCRPRSVGWRRRPGSCPGASRRQPASGSCRSIRVEPAWLTSRFARACGRWLVRATSRSWVSGSIATGVAPRSVTKPWTSR